MVIAGEFDEPWTGSMWSQMASRMCFPCFLDGISCLKNSGLVVGTLCLLALLNMGMLCWCKLVALNTLQVLPGDPFGCFKRPVQGLSDLHLGYQKVTWKKLAIDVCSLPFLTFWSPKNRSCSLDSLLAFGIQNASCIHTFQEKTGSMDTPKKIWMFGSFGKLPKNFKFHLRFISRK